jgi:hypothetical protein
MGKSTLMLSMIVQDILNGKGVGVIDPHADLVRRAVYPRLASEGHDPLRC